MQNWKGYPKRLWHLHPWRFSRFSYTNPQLTWSIVLTRSCFQWDIGLQTCKGAVPHTPFPYFYKMSVYKTRNTLVFCRTKSLCWPSTPCLSAMIFSERWTNKLWASNAMWDSTETRLSKRMPVPKGLDHCVPLFASNNPNKAQRHNICTKKCASETQS